MNTISNQQLLSQMRVLAAQAEQSNSILQQPVKADNQDFSNTLGKALSSINDAQQTANQMQTSFEQGDPNVRLAEVMVAQQKANISFQAGMQVRNKFIEAYQNIMNMPI